MNNPKLAGRKQKYEGGSKSITFRVPVNKEKYIRNIINRWLYKFSKQ